MQRVGGIFGREALPSWQGSEGSSWPLAVALFIRDVYALPATKPFFVPPMDPQVPEHIPVVGPAGDGALADEWAVWFDSLVGTRASIHESAGLMLEERTSAFRQAVENQLEPAVAAAEAFRNHDALDMRNGWKTDGPILPKLVRSIEKEQGHKAAPFDLEIRILPVAGTWLHQVAPQRVLTNRATRSDPAELRRLLGPIVRELA